MVADHLAHVEDTLTRVLIKSDEPIVVALKGGWGEGKTYYWKNGFAAKYKDQRIGYVSVFGADSLAAIRERTILSAAKNADSSGASLLREASERYPIFKRLRDAIPRLGRNWLEKIGIPDTFVSQVMEDSLLQSGWILCIDDVERLSTTITADAFLGYINELRDERNLKVVLVFNDEKVGGDDRSSFDMYREKVIDREIAFVPDVAELLRLVFGSDFRSDEEFLKEMEIRCSLVGLRNIRILTRARSYYREVLAILPERLPSDFKSLVIHSLILFSWTKFTPENQWRITLDSLKHFSQLSEIMRRDSDTEPESNSRVAELLSEYGFTFTDDLALILLRFVESDVLNVDALQQEYQKYLQDVSRGKLEKRFSDVWRDMYHSNLQDCEERFCEALEAATKAYLDYIPISQIDMTLAKLERLGRGGHASELFNSFRKQRPEFADEIRDLVDFSPQYGPFRRIFDQAAVEEAVDSRTIGEVIDNVVINEHINPSDKERLATFSAQDFVGYFASINQANLTSRIRLIRNHSEHDSDEYAMQIHSAITEAVEIIAGRSKLNRLRMEDIGLIKREAESTRPERR